MNINRERKNAKDHVLKEFIHDQNTMCAYNYSWALDNLR